MHFFVTGHTGFKGSWLIALLKSKGHEVSGYSLAAVEGGLFDLAKLDQDLKHHTIADIRDSESLSLALTQAKPDVVVHLAAQPLVLRSYEDPIETYTTNVNGTLNVLQAVTELSPPPITLVVTTDKVYRDTGKGSYSELDALGGHDPYSASKAMADILTQSWAETHPFLLLHIARAGNVIGAFDVSQDRLLPDVIRALKQKTPLMVRHPEAVRPWQHVLDCLNGYLMFVDAIAQGQDLPVALNFGPDPEGMKRVIDVLRVASGMFPDLQIETEASTKLKETGLLTLDSQMAYQKLGWENRLGFNEAVALSLDATLGNPRESASHAISLFLEQGAESQSK
jgi:CDP-glucose 4,6-dehydratase